MKVIADQMHRTSYLAELEFYFVYNLNCGATKVGEGSPSYLIMCEYIDQYYMTFDVVNDLRTYLSLLNQHTDAVAL
jgi:hypothetical protein